MSKVLLALGLPGIILLFSAAAAEGLPSITTLIVPFIVILILVLLNGLFVASEFAIIGVRPSRIEQLADEGNSRAKHVLEILNSSEKQDRYIATAQLGITIASLGLGMYGEPQIEHFLAPYLETVLSVDPESAIIETVSYIVTLSLLTYLHVVIGEMVPKSVALTYEEKVVMGVSRPMQIAQSILIIPVTILNGIGAGVMRLLGVPPAHGHARLHSPEELGLIVTESAEGGLLNEEEEVMIRNIFDFAGRQVGQVMTPRRKVQAIPSDAPLETVMSFVADSNHSRFPVYHNDLDHVIGILHLKDLLHQRLHAKGAFDIKLLLRPIKAVPENEKIEKLLKAFKEQRLHMAIVLDEFGGMAGIVTLEDLIEEVVGEVRDEFDHEREPLVELGPGELELAGDYLMGDLKAFVFLGEDDVLPNVETVGGLVVTGLGRPPRPGDTYPHTNNILFTVLDIDGRAITRLKVTYPTPDTDTPPSPEEE